MTGPLLANLKNCSRLPSPPGVALRLLELFQSDDVSITELTNTLASDPALTLRLLKYANSAMTGSHREITSVKDAVPLVGLRSVRLMALSFSLVTTNNAWTRKGFDYEQFWAHSLACATSARQLNEVLHAPKSEESFTAGLLAHIGKLVFAVGLPGIYPEVLQSAGGTLGRTERHEAAGLGASHHDLGADLLLEWGVPEQIAEAVRHQHDPNHAFDEEVCRLATILGAATDMADILCQAGPDHVLAARREALINSGFFDDVEQLDIAIKQAGQDFTKLAERLSVKQDLQRRPDEIQAEASALLNELSLAPKLHVIPNTAKGRGPQQKSNTDELTGIANRAAFDERLAEIWNEGPPKGLSIAIIMLDVDQFKEFNDTFGTQAGDAVLREVAGCLLGSVRGMDFVARYDGEEFVAILPNVDLTIAAQVAVRIRKVIEAREIHFEGRQHRITVSVGAALLPQINPTFPAKTLVEMADEQLELAKCKGRNCCSIKQVDASSAAQPVAHAV